MGIELHDVADLLERAGDESAQEDEKALMEAALSTLCHAGIVYPDSPGLTGDSFEWIRHNVPFIERWFSARGDRFVHDPVLRMAYIVSTRTNRRGPGIIRMHKDELLVGLALRTTYDLGLMEGEDNRVRTDIAGIQAVLRGVVDASPDAMPSPRRIDAILAAFKDRSCIRIAAGKTSEERDVTILPGIRVLFSDGYIGKVREYLLVATDGGQAQSDTE